jgi:hypothetical protein
VLQKGMEGGTPGSQPAPMWPKTRISQFSPVSTQPIKYRHMDDGQLRLAAAHKCQVCKADVQLGEV